MDNSILPEAFSRFIFILESGLITTARCDRLWEESGVTIIASCGGTMIGPPADRVFRQEFRFIVDIRIKPASDERSKSFKEN